jgi:hypothetical protein
MGFFGRLTNLSKGWAAGLGKSTDTAVVDTELDHDRMNPKPGAEAEAQLAALKGENAATGSTSPGRAPEGPEASDDTEATQTTRPKKTL